MHGPAAPLAVVLALTAAVSAGCASDSAGTERRNLTNTTGPSSTTSERPSGSPVQARGSFLVEVACPDCFGTDGLGDVYLVNAASPEPLRGELRSLTRARLLARLAAVRPQRHADAELRGTLIALRALARRVQALAAEERELKREIEARVTQLAPALPDERGVGPVAAAQVLLSWSHHGRFRSEAAFARLGGAAPIPAASGLVRRHRLDHG